MIHEIIKWIWFLYMIDLLIIDMEQSLHYYFHSPVLCIYVIETRFLILFFNFHPAFLFYEELLLNCILGLYHFRCLLKMILVWILFFYYLFRMLVGSCLICFRSSRIFIYLLNIFGNIYNYLVINFFIIHFNFQH